MVASVSGGHNYMADWPRGFVRAPVGLINTEAPSVSYEQMEQYQQLAAIVARIQTSSHFSSVGVGGIATKGNTAVSYKLKPSRASF
jgi:hypothetical protein